MANAPDCGSGDRGFESHYPPFFYVKMQPLWAVKLMGYRQAVKAQHFDCCIVGSIPTSPVYGTLAQMVEHLTFNQVVGGSSPPCLTFFLFSFSFFLRRHKSLRRRILRVSNEPCTDKNGDRRCEPCSQTDGHIFGRIRRMPRQRANTKCL